jgi:5-methylcytosine-specific restriction endonuclease McrA
MVKCLTLVAHDLGLQGGKYKAAYLARKVVDQRGWQMEGARVIVKRRALELLAQGVRPRKKRTPSANGPDLHRRKPIGAPHPEYVKDAEFYTSIAWRELRLEALRNMRNCQACGRGPQHGVILHVDHIQPRYKAPHLSLVLSNLQVLCEDCNIGKGAWDETDFRHFRSI